MGEKAVLLDKRGGIATIALNRPDAMNSMNQALVDELLEALSSVQNDAEVRAVIITGNGKAFCAGGDLFYLTGISSPIAARSFIAQAGSIVSSIMSMGKVVIAMVNGVAVGAGFNIALACDIVFCAKSVRFAQSFAKVALVPDCGGFYLLPRVIGLHKAKELMFTGDLIDADTALQLGIANKVIEDGELKQTTYDYADRLVNSSPVALSMIKRMVNRSANLDLETTLELEADLQTICMQTADHQEGFRAFKEKRVPIFKGC